MSVPVGPVTDSQPVQQGMVAVLFEKDQRSVRPAILTVKRAFSDIVRASFHARMDGTQDLEVITVNGSPDRIRSLERELMGRRGVRSVRLTLVPRE